jgi:hypothetical protein
VYSARSLQTAVQRLAVQPAQALLLRDLPLAASESAPVGVHALPGWVLAAAGSTVSSQTACGGSTRDPVKKAKMDEAK